MVFKPHRLIGLLIAGAGEIALLAAIGYLTYSILDTPVARVSFFMGTGVALLLLAAAIVGFWLYACFSLRYAVTDGTLVISSGPVQHVVPLSQIERVVEGKDATSWDWQKGLRWPGYSAGFARVDKLGYAVFYSAHRSPEELVFLVTPTLSYALSPSDPAAFAKAIEKARKDKTGAGAGQTTNYWPVMTLSFWQDRKAQMVVLVALVLNAALFGYVLNFFPALPELLPVHFTATGEVDRIGFKTEVLRMPFIALFVLCVNVVFAVLLHIRERLAAYLMLCAGLFVQVLFLVAVIKIVQA